MPTLNNVPQSSALSTDTVLANRGGVFGGAVGVDYMLPVSSLLALAQAGNLISATLSGGSVDWGVSPPAGYIANLTNQIQITPSVNSTLVGLLAATQSGFPVLIINLSAANYVEFSHKSASSASNQFNCPSGMPVALAPFGAATVFWLPTLGWFFS
jgi:hypothetical protein